MARPKNIPNPKKPIRARLNTFKMYLQSRTGDWQLGQSLFAVEPQTPGFLWARQRTPSGHGMDPKEAVSVNLYAHTDQCVVGSATQRSASSNGVQGSNRLGPDVLEPDDIERDFVFRVKSSDAVLLGADLALLMSVLLHDFDAPRKRRIPLFTTVLLHAKPAYTCDRNNGGCYRNLACDCLHSNSIVK
jgi:hypothetical protein